jgi:hypothetical protein
MCEPRTGGVGNDLSNSFSPPEELSSSVEELEWEVFGDSGTMPPGFDPCGGDISDPEARLLAAIASTIFVKTPSCSIA